MLASRRHFPHEGVVLGGGTSWRDQRGVGGGVVVVGVGVRAHEAPASTEGLDSLLRGRLAAGLVPGCFPGVDSAA